MLLFCQAKFKQEAVKMMRGTGGLKRIPVEWLLSYKVQVPTIQKQNEIIKFLHETSRNTASYMDKLKKETIKLKEYRDASISHGVLE